DVLDDIQRMIVGGPAGVVTAAVIGPTFILPIPGERGVFRYGVGIVLGYEAVEGVVAVGGDAGGAVIRQTTHRLIGAEPRSHRQQALGIVTIRSVRGGGDGKSGPIGPWN